MSVSHKVRNKSNKKMSGKAQFKKNLSFCNKIDFVLIFIGGGPQIYVTWFALTSFIIPLLALSFYYARICVRIRQNLRSKELDKERSMKKPTTTTTAKTTRSRRDKDVVISAPGQSSINVPIRTSTFFLKGQVERSCLRRAL